MAIVRLPTECPGCQEVVTLRIAIGQEVDQSFYFVCPSCSSAIRCCLRTDQDDGEVLGLELDGVPALLSPDGEFPVINISTEYPMDPTAELVTSVAGSGFMMHSSLLGDSFHRWRANGHEFEQQGRHSWAEFRRWWGFYQREDWHQFDKVANSFDDVPWPTEPTMFHRHDLIHRFLEFLFVPLYINGAYVNWRRDLFADLPLERSGPVREFVKEWGPPETLRAARQSIFEVLDQFVEQRAQWRPGQLLDEYKHAEVDADPSWRLVRDDFRPLRDLYITTFELSHQYLPLLMGLHNAKVSGDPSTFPDSSIHTTSQLSKMKAFKRSEALATIGGWGCDVDGLLDRKLRNAIGHARATHNLVAGTVDWPKGSIPYSEFVNIVAASAQIPLLLLSAVKYVSIMNDMDPGSNAPD